MIIQKTSLVLRILGIKVEQEELERLVRETLRIEPLNEIFPKQLIGESEHGLCYTLAEQVNKEKQDMERKGKKMVVALIERYPRLSGYDPRKDIIYSEPKPLVLAHEIGHALGIQKHPGLFCDYGCFENLRGGDCPHLNNIMGCGGIPGVSRGTLEFSKKDIKFLRRKYAT